MYNSVIKYLEEKFAGKEGLVQLLAQQASDPLFFESILQFIFKSDFTYIQKVQHTYAVLQAFFKDLDDDKKPLYIENFNKIAAQINTTLLNNQLPDAKTTFWQKFYQDINVILDVHNRDRKERELKKLLNSIQKFPNEDESFEKINQFIFQNVDNAAHMNDDILRRNFTACFGNLNTMSTEQINTTYTILWKISDIYEQLGFNSWPLFRSIYLMTSNTDIFNQWTQIHGNESEDQKKKNFFAKSLLATQQAYKEGEKATLFQSRMMQIGGSFIGVEMILAVGGLVLLMAGLSLMPPLGLATAVIVGGLLFFGGITALSGFVMGKFIRYAHQDALREYNLETVYEENKPKSEYEQQNEHSNLVATLYSKGGSIVEGGLAFAGSVGISLALANLASCLIAGGTLLTISTVAWWIVIPAVIVVSAVFAYSMYKGVLALDGREVKEHYESAAEKKQRSEGFLPLWEKPKPRNDATRSQPDFPVRPAARSTSSPARL